MTNGKDFVNNSTCEWLIGSLFVLLFGLYFSFYNRIPCCDYECNFLYSIAMISVGLLHLGVRRRRFLANKS